MKWRDVDLQLPLLQRELLTLAQKKSTYIVRVACAIGIFWYALTFGLMNWNGNSSNFWYLGKGRDILSRVVEAELFGVYALLPAWMCGLIAAEKERQTLPLLLVTRLGAWRILFEKYCTGMIRVLFIVLLSIPVLAVAYPLGGITQTDLLRGVWTILICAFSVGAISLFCSSLCATTAGAFLATYAILGFLSTFPLLVMWITEINRRQGLPLLPLGTYYWLRENTLMWFYPALFYIAPVGAGIKGGIWSVLGQFTLRSIPVFLQTAFFLILARWVFVTRGLDPDVSWLRRWHRWRRENSLGWSPLNDSGQKHRPRGLPDELPIAWRESHGTLLGIAFWSFMGLCGLIMKYALIQDSRNAFGFMLFTFCEFIAVTLVLVSLATALIQKERMAQTLDVLLSTPISTADFLQQKLQRIWRIWAWFSLYLAIVPLGFAVGLLDVSRTMHSYSGFRQLLIPTLWNYLFTGIIYLPLLVWMSLLISLYCKSQGKALITTVITVLGWTLIPFGLFAMVIWTFHLPAPNKNGLLDPTDITLLILAWASPLGFHFGSVCESYVEKYPFAMLLALTTAGVNLTLLRAFRNRCLNLLPVKLGRLEPSAEESEELTEHQRRDSLVTEGIA
ncbi:MAG: hypothetical protein U0903_10765 [Planctomycetales bacterium]